MAALAEHAVAREYIALCIGATIDFLLSAFRDADAAKRLFRKALSERLLAGDVVVLDDLKLDSPKTKGLVAVLQKLDLLDKTSLLVAVKDEPGALAVLP